MGLLLKMLRPLFHMLFYLSLISDGYSKIHLVKTKGMEIKQKDNSTSGNSKIFLVKTKDMKNKQKDNITSGNNKIYLVKTKDKKNNTRKDNSTSDLTSKKKIRKIGSKGNDYQAEIAGGIAVKNHDYPWMVQIKYGCVGGTCGGALISDRLVLTAYHCTHPSKSKKPCDHSDKKRLAIMGQLELHNKKSTENTGIAIPVIKVIYPEHDHAGFDPKEDSIEDHDFAMYLLETPVKFTDNIQPICLPQQGQEFAGEIAIVAGWGYTESIKKVTDVLRKVNLTVSDKQYDHRKMFGTKLEKNADGEYMDPCAGDSGGPLMKMLDSRKAIIIGTVYGDGYDCRKEKVAKTEGSTNQVWNRVSHWVDWIRDEMKKLNQKESDECQYESNKSTKRKTEEPSPDIPSPGIVQTEQPLPSVPNPGVPDYFPHHSPRGCSCNGYMSGSYGQCKTPSPSRGCYFCYVNNPNTCMDARRSSQAVMYSWSCQACANRYFPQDYPGKGCRPIKGLKVISRFNGRRRVRNHHNCFAYCQQIRTSGRCNAWSYDYRTRICYIYRNPVCYKATPFQGWWSGSVCFGG